MPDLFFIAPTLNTQYDCLRRYGVLDGDGQPTQRIVEYRRKADFITPMAKSKKRRITVQKDLVIDEARVCRQRCSSTI